MPKGEFYAIAAFVYLMGTFYTKNDVKSNAYAHTDPSYMHEGKILCYIIYVVYQSIN